MYIQLKLKDKLCQTKTDRRIRSNNLRKLHDKIDFLSSNQVPALHLEPSARYFDADHDGQLKVPELVAAGFLNPREATFFVRKDMGGEWNIIFGV